MEAGKVTSVHKIEKKVPVEAYLMAQGRFKHLFQSEEAKKEVAKIQGIADQSIERLGLVEKRIGGTIRDQSKAL